MTPADIIRPFLWEADRRKPRLRYDNRFPSCFELTEDTLLFANAAARAAGRPDEWQFIGKTSAMDGAAFRPAWFEPRNVLCKRPDGQPQNVLIDGLGMDAAWYLPTLTQVKVLTNSTANEPGPHEHGPAGLNSYDIPLHNPETGNLQYRWHNPPMPMREGAVVTPLPPPATGGPVVVLPGLPGRYDVMTAGLWLDVWYASKEGLQREHGLSIDGRPDWEGVGAWLFDVWLKARIEGLSDADARQRVITEIQKTDEWKARHPGGAS